jgi:hypothetical protein
VLTPRIADARRLGPPPPDAEVVQREVDGRPGAYGWRDDRDRWFKVPGVGAYRLRAGDSEVVAIPDDPPADRGAVIDEFYTAALPHFLQAAFAYEALHASGVVMPSVGLVAFAGESGSGKSTLAFAFSRRGPRLWADDAVVFSVNGGRAYSTPLPFTLKLRPPSVEYFQAAERPHERDEWMRGGNKLVPLGAIVLPTPTDAAEDFQVKRLSGAEALFQVLPHAMYFRPLSTERMRRVLECYLVVAETIPVLAVRYKPSLARLSGLLDAIERGIRGAAGTAA